MRRKIKARKKDRKIFARTAEKTAIVNIAGNNKRGGRYL